MVVVEKPKTGPHRWELDFCTKCRERTTFWFVAEDRTKCAECGLEKGRGGLVRDDGGPGLGLRPDAPDTRED
jgi:hypothetical protein